MPNKLKPIVSITWEDAFQTSGQFEAEAELEAEDENYTIITIGWLVRDAEKTVSVAMDWEPEGGTFRDVRRIRKENIREMKIIQNGE